MKPKSFPGAAAAMFVLCVTVTASEARGSAPVLAFDFGGTVGRWHAPYGSTTFEFQKDGSVIDNLHGASGYGKTSATLLRGANLAVTYAGNRACYYRALLSKDKKSLFLAEKPPKAPGWPCFTGVLVKSY